LKIDKKLRLKTLFHHEYDNCDLKKGREVHHYVLFDFNFLVFHSLLYKEKKL